MRIVGMVLGLAMAAGGALADEADLLNAAARQALDSVRASIEAAYSAKPALGALKRLGVATIENDKANVTGLLKSTLTKTPFEVVLTSDVDWGPLLDEFARQVKREDLILKETAHELRVQGVDGVLFGTAEKAGVEPVTEGGQQGQRATVRLLLNLASVSEENPGSLLWSEQVTGTADEFLPMSAGERVRNWIVQNRFLVAVIGVILLLWLVMRLYRRATTPR